MGGGGGGGVSTAIRCWEFLQEYLQMFNFVLQILEATSGKEVKYLANCA